MKKTNLGALLILNCLLQASCQTGASSSDKALARKTIDAIDISQLQEFSGNLDQLLKRPGAVKAPKVDKVEVPARLQVSSEDARQIASLLPKYTIDYIVKNGKKNEQAIVYVRSKSITSITAVDFVEKVDGKWRKVI